MRAPRSLVELLRARADAGSDRPAYTFLADGEVEAARLTYAGADRAARAVGAALVQAGCTGERALLLYPNGLEFVAAFWGCLYGGAVAVPAYPPRGERGLPRLRAILDDARPRVVLTTRALLDEVRPWFGAAAGACTWIATDALAEGVESAWRDPGAGPDTLAFLQYTSGSTATPRGVRVSHANLLHNLRLLQEGWRQGGDAVVVSWLPLFHDMGLIGNVLEAVHLGAPCVLMSPAAFLQRPFRWVEAVSRYGATLSGGPNFAFDLAVRRTTPEQRQELDLSRWSVAFNGAEPVRRDTLERFYAAFAPCGMRREALQPGYGLAEATLVVSAGRVEGTPPLVRTFDAAALLRGELVPVHEGTSGARPLVGCGRVVGGQTVAIVDPDTRLARPAGMVGEIWLKGPSVAGGYWGRPGESEATFGATLADTGEGPFLRTGDLGFLHCGELFVAGRAKDLVIVHGQNHYPQDLELTAERAHPAVRAGCSAAFTLDARGEERLVLVCELERQHLRAEPAPVAHAVRRAVAEEHDLPVHRVVLLKTGGITKTTSGKIQRRGCRAALMAGELEVVYDEAGPASAASVESASPVVPAASAELTAPGESAAPAASGASVASARSATEAGSTESIEATEPSIRAASISSALVGAGGAGRSEPLRAPPLPEGAEAELARIREWLVARVAERTGRPAREIDPRASFSSLGISSVAAVGLSGELEEWLGRTLPTTLLYDHPSIGRLARWLAEGASARTAPAAAEGLRDDAADEPIAIVGVGCRFPGADGPEAFWRMLEEGVDAVGEVPAERWDVDALYDPDPAAPGKMTTRRGGFLREVDRFDAAFFGISPREAARMDPQQRLLLEVAWEALEDAAIDPDRLAGSRTGVFVGISTSDYGQRQFTDPALGDAYAGTGGALSIAANRLSYVLDLRGPSLAVDTACSSSLVALHLAVRSLRAGECALALAGGANLLLSPQVTVNFSKAGFMSPDGRCRAFDAGANGYVRAEGAGAVVLKPLARALADGDPVYAVVRGTAVNQDGRSNGLTAPNGDAQEAVLREAYAAAGVDPDAVDYVEAHGTGTPLGDPIEARALGAVVGAGRDAGRPCRIGSVKTNLGHLEAAAGIAGVVKVALALRHRRLPPSLHFYAPNPAIPFQALGLAVQRELAGWPAERGRGVAGVSSFGFGGTNAHAVLAEAPAALSGEEEPAGDGVPRPLLLPLSARDPAALRALAARLRDLLSPSALPFADFAWTAALRRAHHDCRLAVAAATPREAAEALDDFVAGSPHPRLAAGCAVPGRAPRVAFVFGGQGPQWWAMGRELLRGEPVFRAVVHAVDERVRAEAGWSLLDALGADEAGSRLAETEVAQPALFALQVGLAALWARWGVRPAAVAGHSVGEVAAAYVAGALTLDDAVRVVVRRGRRMQEATGKGTMAAVGLTEGEARTAVAPYGGRLSLAAVNAPASVVLSGETPALEEVLDALEARGVFIRRMGVRYAFHSPQMAGAAAALACDLAGLAPRPAAVPLISTVEGRAVDGRSVDAAYWARNVREPVRLAAAVAALADEGCDAFLELAPHPVLSRSIGETLRAHGEEDPFILPSLRRGEDERATLLASLAALYARGAAVEWTALVPERGRVVAFPRYPWQRERHWMEPAPGQVIRAGDGAAHPLLGAHLELAEPAGTHVWETEADPGTLARLGIAGEPVPAAVLAATVTAAAARAAGPGAHAVEALRVAAELVLDEPRTLHLVLSPEGEAGAAFRLYARPAAAPRAPWMLHAEGRVRLAPAPVDAEVERRAVEAPAAAPEVPTRDAILAAESDERAALLEAHLRARLAAVLRMAPARVDADRPLSALGLDSLMAIEVRNAVERDLGVPLPIRVLLAGPTLRTLAADLLPQVTEGVAPAEGDEGDLAEAPATYGQRAIWLLQQMEPETPLFNVFAAIRIAPAADASALRRALARLVERHAALRTALATRDGRPVLEVRAAAEAELREIDAADWPDETVRERLEDEAHRPFDPAQTPLLRAALYRRGAAEDVLLLVLHHAAVDFWSNVTLLGDLAALYAQEAGLPSEPLPPPGRPYTAYAHAQARLLAGPEGERLWAYWRDRLAGASTRLALPADLRPAARTGAGAVHRFRLGPERAARVRAFAQERGTTPFTLLLAAWHALLHRWTRDDDLLVAAPMAGRGGAEWEGTVGCFMNLVVLRGDLAGGPGFGELLDRTRETVLEALQHQEMPMALLAERIPALREAGGTAPVQAMFVFNRPHRLQEAGIAGVMAGEPGATFAHGAWTMEALPLDERTTPCELCLWATEVEGDLSLRLQYAAELFTPAAAARIVATLPALLDAALDDPNRPVATLSLLDPAACLQVAALSSGEGADFPRPLVHHALAGRAAAHPGATAVIAADATLSYAELDAAANRLAHHLRATGVGPESIVGVCLERSAELIVALYAILKTGGAYLPLDPAHPEERHESMLRDAGARVVVTRRGRDGGVPAGVPVVRLDADRDGIDACPSTDPGVAVDGVQAAYVIYTSGSTGRPKGTVVPHAALANHTASAAQAYGIGPADRVLQFASAAFDASAEEIFPALARGARLVVRPDEITGSAAAFLAFCARHRVTVLDLPTAFWHALTPALRAGEGALPPSVRLVILGGERALPERLAEWRAAVGGRVRLVNSYGPTEATVVATRHDVTGEDAAAGEVPIGRPIHHVAAHVLDAAMQPVPHGMPGELFLGGAGVARGYLGRPGLTAERFVPDPFAGVPGARLYATGDLARRRGDGTLEFAGRLDAQVKVRGYRVEPGEVEAALMRHPDVRAAAVAAREDAPGERRLVAYVVAHGAPVPPARELREFLGELLPEWMLPAAFVFLDALPLTPGGKTDRRALPAPDAGSVADDAFTAPRTPAEALLAGIWAQVLGRERVGVHDPFFALGGDSILALQVVARARRAGVELPPQLLLKNPSVARLAAALGAGEPPALALDPAAVRSLAGADAVLTPATQP